MKKAIQLVVIIASVFFAQGNGLSQTVTIVANPLTVCVGSSSTLTVSTTGFTPAPNLTYTWSCTPIGNCTAPGLSTTPNLSITADVTPTVSTTYTVTVTDGSATSSTSVVVTVNTISEGSIAASQTICSGGDPAAFTSTMDATGGGTITYQWQSNSTSCNGTYSDIPGATSNTFDPPGGLTTTTFYRRVATSTLNGIPCLKNSNCLTVTVNTISEGSIATDQTICSGGNPAAFTSTTDATGGGNITYQWQSNTTTCNGAFSNIAGATNKTFDPPNGLPTTTNYRRVATSTLNGNTCVANSNCLTVTVNTISAGSIAADQTICSAGDPAPFSSSMDATGGGNITYQWQSNTTTCNGTFSNIPGATSSTFDPPSGLPTTTNYRRVATSTLNGNACAANSNCLTVTVNTISAGSIGSSQTICSGGNPNSFTSSADATGSGTITYQWQLSTSDCNGSFTDIVGATAKTFDPPGGLTTTTFYRRVATSTLNGIPCISNSNCLTVTINTISEGGIAADQTICSGGNPAAFTSTTDATGGGAISYQWQSNTTTCNGTFGNIAGATSSTFDPPSGLATTTNYRRVATSTLNGNTCVANSNCLTVNVKPNPVASATPPTQTICSNSETSISLSSNINGSTFDWTVSQNNVSGGSTGNGLMIKQMLAATSSTNGTATYSVTATADGCASIPLQVVVTVRPTPTAAAAPSIQTICQVGTTAALGGSVGGSATGGTWSTTSGGTFLPTNTSLNATWTPPPTFNGTAILVLTTTGMSPCIEVSANVTVNVLATATVSTSPSSHTICQDGVTPGLKGAVGGSATGGSWSSINGGTFSPSATTLDATWAPPPGFSGSATLTLMTTGMDPCAAKTATVTVAVRKTPTVAISGDATICSGSGTNITFYGGPASGVVTYKINGGSDQTTTLDATGAKTLATGTLNSSAIYTLVSVKYPSAPECSNSVSGSATVTVNQTPVITNLIPSNPTTCGGTEGFITVNGLQPNTTYLVEFSKNGGAPQTQSIISNSFGSVIINNLTKGNYNSFAVTLLGCRGSNSTSLALQDPPLPAVPSTSQQTTRSECASSFPINLNVNPIGGIEMNWFKDGIPFSNNQNSISISSSGLYEVEALNPTTKCNSATKLKFTITSVANPGPPTTTNNSISRCQSQLPVTLSVTPPGGSMIDWFNVNTGGSAIGTGNTLQHSNIAPNVYTYFAESKLTAAPNCRSLVRTDITVTINPTPTEPTQSNDNVSFCQVDVQNGTSIISATPPGAATINWYSTATGGVPLSTGSNTFLHTNTVPNTYSYFAESELPTGPCKSTSRKQITVTIKPTPTMIPTADKSFCAGDAVNLTFTSSPTGSVFSWQNNNMKTGLLKTNDIGNISFTAAANDSPNSETSTIKVTPTLNQCKGAEREYLLTLKPTPQLVSIATFKQCSGTLFDLPNFAIEPINGNPAQNYSWTNNNTAIGLSGGATGQIPNFTPVFNVTGNDINGTITYTVTVTGCVSAPKSYQVTVFPQPQLGFTVIENAGKNLNDVTSSSDMMMCENDSISLTTNVTKCPIPHEYLWSLGTNTQQKLIDAPTAGSPTYTVTVTDGNKCTNMFSKTITVNRYPIVNISVNETSGLVNDDEKICSKDEVTLTANPSNGSSGVYSFAWNTNNFTTKTITNNPVTPPSQNYVVSVTNLGCRKVETKNIEVFGLPTADISDQNVGGKILQDKDAFFKDVSSPFPGSTLVSWLWNFQNASPSPQTTQNPNPVKFTKTGSQTVSLKVTDSHGCMHTSSKPFTVQNPDCDGQFQDFPAGPFCLIKDSSILLSFKIRLGTYSAGLNGDWNALPPGAEWVEKPLINASLVNMTKDAKLKVTKSGTYEIGFFYTDPNNPKCQNVLLTQSFIVNAAPTALVTFDKTKANYCQGDTVGVLVKLSGKAPFTYRLSNTAVITSPVDTVRVPLLTNDITKFKDKNLGFSVVTLKDDNTCVAKEVNSVVATDSVLIHSLPEFLNYTAGCSPDKNKFAVSFDIGAAKSPFTFESDGITKNLFKTGPVGSKKFTSDSIDTKIGGNPFIITITDVLGCKATKIDTSNCQAGCDTARGTFVADPLKLCEGDTVIVPVQNSPATGPKVIKDFILVKDNDWNIDKLRTQSPNPILILHRWKGVLRYNDIVGKISLDELYHIYEIYGGDTTGFKNLDEACLKITERGLPIIFHQTPTIKTINFAKAKICNKDEVFLKFNFLGKAPFTFKLDKRNNDSKLDSLVDSLIIRKADYNNENPFKICVSTITDKNNCTNKSPQACTTLIVNPLPEIDTAKAVFPLTYCKNKKDIQLTVLHKELVPKRGYSYNWTFNKADSTKIKFKNDSTIFKKTLLFDLLNGNTDSIEFEVKVKDSLNFCTDSYSLQFAINDGTAPEVDTIVKALGNKPNTGYVLLYPSDDKLCYKWEVDKNATSLWSEASCYDGNNLFYCENKDSSVTNQSKFRVVIWFKSAAGDCKTVNCSNTATTIRESYLDNGIADPLQLLLHPNPNDGDFAVTIQGGLFGKYKTTIIDNVGRVVHRNVFDKLTYEAKMEMNQWDLPNGIYFFQLRDPEGKFFTLKFIVQH